MTSSSFQRPKVSLCPASVVRITVAPPDFGLCVRERSEPQIIDLMIACAMLGHSTLSPACAQLVLLGRPALLR
jgi:hypothetical protein